VASAVQAAALSRESVFSSGLLKNPKTCAPVLCSIARCPDAAIRCWMKAVCGIYPTTAYLHRIGLAPSPSCPFCPGAVPETLGHFACVCPRFHNARTAAHDRSWTKIVDVILRYSPSDWKFCWETPMSLTGLRLAPCACGCTAGSPDRPPAEPNVLNLRPDGVGVNPALRRIAILEHSRPNDATPQQLLAARERKQHKYLPILHSLSHYVRLGWSVAVLPWISGIRGILDTEGIETALAHLDIPPRYWCEVLRRTAIASVESLHFMHRVRYSLGSLSAAAGDVEPPFTPDVSLSGGKRKCPTPGDAVETMSRWKRLATAAGRRGD
jgi:hypothetical protein